ncbi:hypothetical protein V6U78_03330 [Marinospirillum sp. MEB164]|uniref:Type VI secretion lipoprotein, VC_A0113 family n=1 Tax=Marinospirillum alkalitolerans TaxID=3123374 RepID=A0ABW8PUV7_9GAMM
MMLNRVGMRRSVLVLLGVVFALLLQGCLTNEDESKGSTPEQPIPVPADKPAVESRLLTLPLTRLVDIPLNADLMPAELQSQQVLIVRDSISLYRHVQRRLKLVYQDYVATEALLESLADLQATNFEQDQLIALVIHGRERGEAVEPLLGLEVFADQLWLTLEYQPEALPLHRQDSRLVYLRMPQSALPVFLDARAEPVVYPEEPEPEDDPAEDDAGDASNEDAVDDETETGTEEV